LGHIVYLSNSISQDWLFLQLGLMCRVFCLDGFMWYWHFISNILLQMHGFCSSHDSKLLPVCTHSHVTLWTVLFFRQSSAREACCRWRLD